MLTVLSTQELSRDLSGSQDTAACLERRGVGMDYTGKPYRYNCLAGDSENFKSANEIEMVASFEIE